jgi:lysophospholipase L1-like esterase
VTRAVDPGLGVARMRRFGPPITFTVVLVSILLVQLPRPAAAGVGSSPQPARTISINYLALGDSVPVWDGTKAYPYQIAHHYHIPRAVLDDIAESGATTDSMLNGGQMTKALAYLSQHQGSPLLITIDIGGNDLLGCIRPPTDSVDMSCVQSQENSVIGPNLQTILTMLRGATGSNALIVGMNYYDPLLANWLASNSEQPIAESTASDLDQFNAFLLNTYRGFGISSADVATAFHINDFTTTKKNHAWGVVPTAVYDACKWLDVACHVGSPWNGGDDPVAKGQVVIGKAFDQVIGSSLP